MEKLRIFNFEGQRYAITEFPDLVKDLDEDQFFIFSWEDLYNHTSDLAVFVMSYFTIKSECVYVIELD